VLRERVSHSIHVCTSELYAQVTAGIIATPAGAVVIDTLPFPSETREMTSFIEEECPGGARYVVLTHYHADHTNGAYLFPEAEVVAHALCAELLLEVGQRALDAAKAEEPALEEVRIRLPSITFDGPEMALQLGGTVMRLIHSPGHTLDSLMVYVEEDRVLFAADTLMPVPSIVDGDLKAFRASLAEVVSLPIENVVQGHGEVVLRGEVEETVQASLEYLDTIEEAVRGLVAKGGPRRRLGKITLESCGLSRIPLNGMVQDIHEANLRSLYERMGGS
jgi:cyclase